MPAFSEDQRIELVGFIDAAIELGRRSASAYTNSRVTAAIEEERERLARIVETCEPVADFADDDPAGLKGEVPDLAETLVALGKAIRTRHHE
jgi:hypothetical protein